MQDNQSGLIESSPSLYSLYFLSYSIQKDNMRYILITSLSQTVIREDRNDEIRSINVKQEATNTKQIL